MKEMNEIKESERATIKHACERIIIGSSENGEEHWCGIKHATLPNMLKRAALEAFMHDISNRDTTIIREALFKLQEEGYLG